MHRRDRPTRGARDRRRRRARRARAFYPDADGDGFGDAAAPPTSAYCPPADHVLDHADCDDASAARHPGAAEICGDGIDDDCVGGDAACTSSPELLFDMPPLAVLRASPRKVFAHYMRQFPISYDNQAPAADDWVQLVTWNDFQEHSVITPNTGTGYLFYDLAAYYLVWFKTGSPPPIVRDGLYYAHREHPVDAAWTGQQRSGSMAPLAGSPTPEDRIELLAFLTAPGTLEIEVGGSVETLAAPAGITSFAVPLALGRPVFRLRRGGAVVEEVTSAWTIVHTVEYQDFMMKGGSSSRPPLAQVDLQQARLVGRGQARQRCR